MSCWIFIQITKWIRNGCLRGKVFLSGWHKFLKRKVIKFAELKMEALINRKSCGIEPNQTKNNEKMCLERQILLFSVDSNWKSKYNRHNKKYNKKTSEFNNKFIYTIYFELKNKYKFIQFEFSGGANNNLIWFCFPVSANALPTTVSPCQARP